jgi:hypothetical protein
MKLKELAISFIIILIFKNLFDLIFHIIKVGHLINLVLKAFLL